MSAKTSLRYTLAGAVALAALSATPMAQAQVTGDMRATATPAATEAQAPAAKRGATGPRGLLTGKVNPQPVRHADGTVEQELDESSLIFTVATRQADGTLDTACVTGKAEADAALQSKKPAAAHKHLELK